MSIERIAIVNRDQWLSERAKDITASSAAALLGVHPYMTALSLYCLKAGMLHEDPDESPAMRRGRMLEPVAVQLLREERPDWQIDEYPHGWYYRDTEARIGATPDVLARDEGGRLGVVQIKSVEPTVFRKLWRQDDGSVEPPVWIACQAIIEATLTGAEWAAVAPIVVGFGLELPVIPIPIHAGVYDRIKADVAEFWRRVENSQPYAPDYGRDGDLIARLYPQDDGTEIDLSGDNEILLLVDQLEVAREDKKAAEASEKTAKTAIATKLGSASSARLVDGRRITNKTQHRAGYVVEPTDFRVLRISKGRAA